MHRRELLVAGAGAVAAGLAGCEQRQVSTGPTPLEDPPDAVYVPTHTDEMTHVATQSAGRLRFALSYAQPHTFWLLTGTRVRRVEVADEDALHLMLTVWDDETGISLPASNATATITRNGEQVVEKSFWSMLSQRMGVHFGDNVVLDGNGTYTVDVRYGPVESRLAGDLADLDPSVRSISTDLGYEKSTVAALGIEELGDRAGQRDAVSPMDMGMLPVSQLPTVDALPGRLLGSGRSGDAELAATALPAPPTGIDGDGPYLAVSPRTPYNRYPLPFASFSIGPDGETPLVSSIDPDLGFHYGRVLDGEPDTVRVTVDAPPQLARHEGYETAFVEMDPISLGSDSG